MNKQQINKSFEFGKIDLANREIEVQFMQAFEPDLHGDIVYPEEIKRAMDIFMEKYQVIGRMHRENTRNFITRIKDGDDFSPGGFVVIKITEESDWQKITNGEYGGVSWGGMAYSTPLPSGHNLLTQIELMEISLVDRPAVQAARFKAADGQDGEMSLVQQIAGGKVKPRVRASKSIGTQLTEALAGVITKFLHDPTGGGGNPTTEDDDMGMTPEEKAVVDGLQKSVESLTATVEGLTKQLEAGKPEDKQTEEGKAGGLDLAELGKSIGETVTKAVGEAVKPLADQLEAIGKQGAPSHELHSDGSKGDGGKSKSYSWKK